MKKKPHKIMLGDDSDEDSTSSDPAFPSLLEEDELMLSKNVGKSLRGAAMSEEEGERIKASSVFDWKAGMETGPRRAAGNEGRIQEDREATEYAERAGARTGGERAVARRAGAEKRGTSEARDEDEDDEDDDDEDDDDEEEDDEDDDDEDDDDDGEDQDDDEDDDDYNERYHEKPNQIGVKRGLKRKAKVDDDNSEAEEPPPTLTIRKSSSTQAANPKAAREQRKIEGDLLGVRIRLQGVLDILKQMPNSDGIHGKPLMQANSVLRKLVDVRRFILANGSEEMTEPFENEIEPLPLGKFSLDDAWLSIESSDDALWGVHKDIVERWERRTLLATGKGKTLRVVSKGVFEQTEAAVARRQELGKLGDFIKDDAEFYQQLLKDFVQSRTASTSAGFIKKRNSASSAKRAKYVRSKEPQVNHTVHEKLVNFLPPHAYAAPVIDVDQLVKSLWRS